MNEWKALTDWQCGAEGYRWFVTTEILLAATEESGMFHLKHLFFELMGYLETSFLCQRGIRLARDIRIL